MLRLIEFPSPPPSQLEVRGAITNVIGQAQLLARKLERGDTVDAETIVRTLRIIERSGWRAASELDRLDSVGTRLLW